MKRYELLGIEEAEWVCDFCHKKHINRCFTVRDLDTGDVMRFGSTCIRKALNIKTPKLTDMMAKKRNELNDIWQAKIMKLEKANSEAFEQDAAILGELESARKEYWRLYKLYSL